MNLGNLLRNRLILEGGAIHLPIYFTDMKKYVHITIQCLLILPGATSQNYFNIVINGPQNNISGVYHPLIEIDKDSLIIWTSTNYLDSFGGQCLQTIINNQGTVLNNKVFLDSVDYIFISDAKLVNNCLLTCGSKINLIDTLEIFWVGKLDSLLDTVWTKEIKTVFNSPTYRSIIVTSQSLIAVCGNDVQSRKSGSIISSKGVIQLFDSLGKDVAKIEIRDSNHYPLFYNITEAKDKNIYACGIVKKNNDLNHDAIVVKISPDGKLLWRKQIPSPDYLEGVFNAFVQDDGSILFIGDSYNPDFFGDKFSVVLLINMSPNGLINWTKRIMKIYDGEIRYCVEDPSNNYICSGTYFSEAGKKGDGYLVKFSANGDSIWSRIINKSDRSTEQFFNISKASDEGFYLTGFSWIDSINTSKSWVVKVDSFGCLVPGCHKVVDTKDVSNGKIAFFEFFPNPASHVFYFLSRINDNGNYQLKLVDLQGREIFQYSFQPVSGKQYVVEIPDQWSSGIYTLGVFDENGKMVQVEKMELH